MATMPGDLGALRHEGMRSPKGPITAARQRRTALVYASMCLLGLLPALIDAPAAWQTAGLGLWLPGAGFVAVGGFAVLLFPLTLLLFFVSLVAWFWAGMVVAPVAVWLGSAALAGALADGPVGVGSYVTVAVCMAAIAAYALHRTRRRQAADEGRARIRRAFVPQSLAEVETRAKSLPRQDTRELSTDQLASLRYLFDRALQPIEQFGGFDVIDQFQPAALRYQLNHMGFALGLAQCAYTPNFRGYAQEAQRNLIEKYLLRRVWDYWVYESCWGHLNFTDFDPARRDNIMLTGWFGMHVGQYTLVTGDLRYAEPGSLTFRLNARTAYPHDLHSLVGSVVENYARYEREFCIFPCEPNWMYPICNHYGMTALAVHDRLFGTSYVARFLPTWLEKLDAEFTDAKGSIIGLRSQLTGFEFPFPTGEAGYANFAHCFAPERARRLWAIARKEIEPLLVRDDTGRLVMKMPGRGLDAGNYRFGHTGAYASIAMAAREFGDDDIADAALAGLDRDCGLATDGGVRRYLGGSNLTNANAVMAQLMSTGDFRRSFVEGPEASALEGPVLTEVRYPDVLVARARSTGEDLDLVLHPGAGVGVQTLTIERLVPGRTYAVTGAMASRASADAMGRLRLDVDLNGRTSVRLAPVA